MDAIALPNVKRRRLTSKTAPPLSDVPRTDAQSGPTLTIARSRNSNSLMTASITAFPPDYLGLAPLALLASVGPELSDHLTKGAFFKVKVEIEWLTAKPNTDEQRQYFMSFTPIRVSPENSLGQMARANINELIKSIRRRAIDKMEFAKEHESSIVFLKIVAVRLTFVPLARDVRVNPFLEASNNSGGCSCKLPKSLVNKHCCINIQNKGIECFRYCMLAWEHKAASKFEKPERASSYWSNASSQPGRMKSSFVPEFIASAIDFTMLTFPVQVCALTAFEEENNIGVYVFVWHEDGKGLGFARALRKPCRIYDREVQLLLHKGHYLLVTRFKALMSLRQHGVGSDWAQPCHRCLNDFYNATEFEQHLAQGRCLTGERKPAEGRLPVPLHDSNRVFERFAKYELLHDAPVIVYADFETYQIRIDQKKSDRTDLITKMNGVASYGFYVASSVPCIASGVCMKRGNADDFILKMLNIGFSYRRACNSPMPLCTAELEDITSESRCYACAARDCKLVYDHDHFTGRYRGLACQSCNVKMQTPKTVTILFHNLEAFDGHELILAIMRLRGGKHESIDPEEAAVIEVESEDNYSQELLSRLRFTIVANSIEKYMQIGFGPLLFRDSFKFNSCSLAKMIDSQRQARPSLEEAFPITNGHHPFLQKRRSSESLNLLLRKVPMAYTSMTSPAYFDMPAVLPQKAYDNDLQREACSDELYALVHNVVEHFDIENQGDYHDLYLFTDVLTLADCMETMRTSWRVHCGLDLLQSVTLPSASYQAMLKKTAVRMELISEENGGMEFMKLVNTNIRGGVSCIFQPYATANNYKVLPKLPPNLETQYSEVHERVRAGERLATSTLPSDYVDWCGANGYDHKQELSWIVYVDANSLYPTTMTLPLPIGDYKKEPLPDLQSARVKQMKVLLDCYTDASAKGFMFEVSYRVPEKLHDKFDFAPVAKREIKRSELSKTQLDILEKIGGNSTQSVKLFPYLGVHEKVLHHISLLKYMVELGIEVFEVHSAWSFRQSRWMAEYILSMARQRAEASEPSVKEVIKKAMNSLYGKMLQDKSANQNFTPYTDAELFTRAASKGKCLDFKIMHLDSESDFFFGLVETEKAKGPLLDTPRAAGFTILELSKLLIWKVHYGYYKAVYGDRAKLLFTDTDSLCYKIVSDRDVLLDMLESREVIFDIAKALPRPQLERLLVDRLGLVEKYVLQLAEAKGLLGAMKLESEEAAISEFVGLAAKMYSILMVTPGGEFFEMKKGKGVPGRVLKNEAPHAEFRRMVLEPFVSEVTFRALRSYNHEVHQVELTKRLLTAFNDKVYQLSATASRPLGHWRNSRSADDGAEPCTAEGCSSSSGLIR